MKATERLIPLLVAALALCIGTSPALAHPFHFSFAEGEWNGETQRLEISLRLEPHDLELALRQQTGQAVKLEDAATEKLMAAYLKQALQFETAQGKPAEIEWVGAEIKIKAMWLYFEVPLPEGLEGVKITNTLLLESLPKQVNVVALKQGEKATALHFSAKKTTLEVELQEQPSQTVAEDMPE